jgi:hypothetical protein
MQVDNKDKKNCKLFPDYYCLVFSIVLCFCVIASD